MTKRLKIFALIAFRDEKRHLPGFFSHLRNYIDGFIAFNDCSTDNSMKIAQAEPKMVHLLQRQIPSSDHQFEIENRLALLISAHKNGADWLLCADADERFETRFLEQLQVIVQNPPAQVLGMRWVALWENFQQHRVGKAQKFVLFPSTKPEPYHRPGLLHQQWFPPSFYRRSQLILDYYLYHLGSLTRADRMERYEKFNRIDPDCAHQPQGYENIISESDLQLAPVLPARRFRYE
jgi:hypothetical protein